MDSGFTLIVKIGTRRFAKKCSVEYTRSELLSCILAKSSDLSKDEVFLSYELLGAGEMDLADDDDMDNMFRLLEESHVRRVHIYVRKVKSCGASGPDSSVANAVYDVGECSNVGHVGLSGDTVVGGSGETKLTSEEWRLLIVGPGQRFPGGVVQFRRALIKYSVQVGFEFEFVKNGRKRVTAVCRFRLEKECPWRIQAVEDATDGAFCISSYERTHTCGTVYGAVSRKRLNHHIITDIIIEDIRSMPTLSPTQVQAVVKKNYGIDISYCIAWKAMDRGKELVFGDHSVSFSRLPAYFDDLKAANPGSYVHLDVNEEHKFKRCFFAFQACLLGFTHCRPMMMIDGTFLKGRHKGCLLSAVAKDSDEGLFPVAFAVVNEETDDNWSYFFEHLRSAVGVGRRLVFISDRNHGILKAVPSIFPESLHAFCYNHLKANLEYRCRGMGKKVRAVVLRYFQQCAYATMPQDYEENVQKLVNVGGNRVEAFLKDTPAEMWANAFFPGLRYGQMTSNAVESWNAHIREERLLPIVSMIDAIRGKLMQQFCNRRQQSAGWVTKLCKSYESDVNAKVDEARGWDMRKASEDVWEVFSRPTAVVDLRQRSCTCRLWRVLGFPCIHAAAVIFLRLNADYAYVDPYFYADAYRATYAHVISHFCITEAAGQGNLVYAPDYHQTRGRPKRRRIPSQGEKIPRKIRCGRCGTLANHNKKTCRNGGEGR